MRHNKKFNHLGRKKAHREAMLSNMAASLILHKRIFTTVAKAKALRALSLFEEVAELTLEYAIGVLSLLLFLELDAIFARLTTAVVAVLSRRIVLLGEYLVGTEDRCAKLTGDL